MSKNSKRKTAVERRKHPRSNPKRKAVAKSELPQSQTEYCYACSKDLKSQEKALFVEEEIGRVFCSEDCITQYFQPEIERLESDYFKHRPKDDLTPEEREQFAHLRWVTLQEPDEVWRKKGSGGELHYTLISEFKPASKSVWCVCQCLFLRGEPSFLFLAFPTKSAALAARYRKGERVEWVKAEELPVQPGISPEGVIDGLAAEWTDQSEINIQKFLARRASGDIPEEEFGDHENLVEPTLEEPDELWVEESKDEGEPDHYTFIRHFETPSESSSGIWYIILAKESEDGEQLEVVGHFPCKLRESVEAFRRGRQEVELDEDSSSSRTVH